MRVITLIIIIIYYNNYSLVDRSSRFCARGQPHPFSQNEQIKNPLATTRRWRARGEDLIYFAPTFYSGTSSIIYAVFNLTRLKHYLQYLPRSCEYSLVLRPSADPVNVSLGAFYHDSVSCYTRRKRFCKLINRQVHQKSLCSMYLWAPGLPYIIIIISYTSFILREICIQDFYFPQQ